MRKEIESATMKLGGEQGERERRGGLTQTLERESDCGASIFRPRRRRGSRSEQPQFRTQESGFVREEFIDRAIKASTRSYQDIDRSYQDIRNSARSYEPEGCECHHHGHEGNTEPSCTCFFAASPSSWHRGRSDEDGDDVNASRKSESRAVTGLADKGSSTDAEKHHGICLFNNQTAAENVR